MTIGTLMNNFPGSRLPFFTDYAKQSDDFVIPEDLSTLTDAQLAELHTEAIGHFDSVFGDGKDLSEDSLAALGVLTEGIESLAGELSSRQELAVARAESAAQLAQRVHTEERSETIEDVEEDAPAPEDGEAPADAPVDDEPAADAPSAIVASSRKEFRVNLGNVSRRAPKGLPRQQDRPLKMQDLVYAAGDGTGYAIGQGVDWNDLGRIVDRRLAGFNEGQFQAAARAGKKIAQQFSVATFRKPIPQELMVSSNDPEHVDAVFARATDQKRLPGGSLVAAGGWCAPSEILYDFLELESRDGLLSIPEIGVARGGIQFTTGIDYSTIYAAIGWSYTEAQDIAGTYAVTDDADDLHPGSGSAGTKPCYTVPCPTFTEARLSLAGLCLSAGLLQQRGYPEVIARTVRGALVAHDHKMSARVINAMVTGSTAVTMTQGTLGTLAPLLDAIEKQVEHYRYVHRLSRGTVLEAVFPYWVHGAVRSDLALRNGVDMTAVTDGQINSWFASRGVAPQFVYDWQPLTGNANAFLTWPSTVKFLLYVAGTWVKGTSDVITLDTIYDSTLLGNNNFTALFTEEGYLVAKRGLDSRCVEVPVCSNGATSAPYQMACDGTAQVTDNTVPTAGTSASSSITSTGFTLTVTGASDAGVGLAAKPYRFSTDGGETWSAWQAAASKAFTGLTTGTAYLTQHEVRDAAGNIRTGTALTVTTS